MAFHPRPVGIGLELPEVPSIFQVHVWASDLVANCWLLDWWMSVPGWCPMDCCLAEEEQSFLVHENFCFGSVTFVEGAELAIDDSEDMVAAPAAAAAVSVEPQLQPPWVNVVVVRFE